jgi:CDP-6-deoxy-D-xylo-4-hexulose-3-dehydrase
VKKEEVLEKVREYYREEHMRRPFRPGKSKVHYAGRVYDEEEMASMADALLDFMLTYGPRGVEFEKEFAMYHKVRKAVLVNSGSSANLVAVSALCSPQLRNRLRPGDEVITPAVTFPTTLNPLLQNNLVPVFVDIDLGTYNINIEGMRNALSDKTRAVMLPHTLGNPNDMDTVMDFVQENELFLIEDACDALDSRYDGKLCGTFGDLGTFSFYPAHHITMGEGGAILTNSGQLARICRSLRDWGRSCYCTPGEINPLGACGRRFEYKVGSIPYDHKYMYSNIGYNLKPLDLQAAMGLVQLKKLRRFTEARKRNFRVLYRELQKYEDSLILPESVPKADPSWFAFPITVRKNTAFRRDDIVRWLEKNNIETRLLFAGNITRQPAYRDAKYRIQGTLENSDRVMRDTFFIGVYPGIDEEQMEYVINTLNAFFRNQRIA